MVNKLMNKKAIAVYEDLLFVYYRSYKAYV